MVMEDMAVFCVFWIAAAATFYWSLIVFGSSNKTVAEVRACFDLEAADISDLGFSVSYEFLVYGLWSLGLALSGNQFLSSWWVFHPCLDWFI